MDGHIQCGFVSSMRQIARLSIELVNHGISRFLVDGNDETTTRIEREDPWLMSVR